MRSERRFSSMTLMNRVDFKKNLVKIKILNIWFSRYLAEKSLQLTRPLSHYIELVENFESEKKKSLWFFTSSLALAVVGVFMFLIAHKSSVSDGSTKMVGIICVFLSVVAIGITFMLFYLGIVTFSRVNQNRPRATVLRLVNDYRKVLVALDTTSLWSEFVYSFDDSVETESQISELQRVNTGEASVPQFLIEIAESKLHELGKQISELEAKYKSGEAAVIRNGLFASCFKHAVLFGVIPEKTGFGKYIPEPVF